MLRRVAAPIFRTVNMQRQGWGLPPLDHPADALSTLAQITQLPEALEFPRTRPNPLLHYTGPLVDSRVRPTVEFPWERLDGRPVTYASLGTIQNGADTIFRAIAEACSRLNVQLVISLGGARDPASLGVLPGSPLVVRFAPQLELLKRAAALITHAGLNTVLEALAEGVPMVAIPLGNDQPGVASRVAHHGAGIVISPRSLTIVRLRRALQDILERDTYRASACKLQTAIRQTDALETAADVVEEALSLRSLSRPQVSHS